jgi:hypothetical protein
VKVKKNSGTSNALKIYAKEAFLLQTIIGNTMAHSRLIKISKLLKVNQTATSAFLRIIFITSPSSANYSWGNAIEKKNNYVNSNRGTCGRNFHRYLRNQSSIPAKTTARTRLLRNGNELLLAIPRPKRHHMLHTLHDRNQ